VSDKKPSKFISVLTTVILVVMLLVAVFAITAAMAMKAVKRMVKVETGTTITRDDFLNSNNPIVVLKTDINQIDTSKSGTYQIKFNVMGFNIESILYVRDETAPTGEAVPQNIYAYHIPAAGDTVTNLYDNSGVVNVYYGKTPDLSKAGSYEVSVVLVDLYENSSVIKVPFTVTEDNEAPMINGAKVIDYYIGDNLMLLDGVYATDNIDPNPSIEVDVSGLNPNKEGKYQITYVATDEYGNIGRLTVDINVKKKPDHYYEPETVYKVAQKVYDKIIGDEELTETEKVDRIFKWARTSIKYTGDKKKYTWTHAAYKGFNTLKGDCYNYYACCKALLDIAGIDNKYVYGIGEGNKFHCWNLVKIDGEWWHCDACPSAGHKSYWIKKTDAELDPRFKLVTNGLPPRATK